MRVLFVTTEMDDFIRVGGLAAVSAALPRALRSWSDVRIMLPGYRDVIEQLAHVEILGQCSGIGEMPACSVGRAATRDGMPVYVLLCQQLYDRPGNPYGDEAGKDWPDNDIRFARFASAAAELAMGKVDKNWAADLVHANDWQAALVPAYLAWKRSRTPTILTIHNLAYQGLFPRESLRRIGAPEDSFHIDGLEFYDKLSFLKGGLIFASHLTTVSSTYAHEITTPEFGCGLEGLLRKRSHEEKLTGILNGIDETWDPRVCPQLAQPFAAGDWEGKQANSDYVRKQFRPGRLARTSVRAGRAPGTSEGHRSRPVGGGRDHRRWRPDRGDGKRRSRTGERAGRSASTAAGCHRRCDRVQRRPGTPHLRRQRFHADALALRALRPQPDVCATLRVVADRSSDGRSRRNHRGRRHGILFAKPSTEALLGSVRRAFSTFDAKDRLDAMRRSAMAKSYSWELSAACYGSLYRRIVASPAAA